MIITRVLSAFFFIVAIGLTVVLIRNIKSKIDEDEYIKNQEALVINKLKMIRDAQVAYLTANGKYTGNFDTLISFIDTGKLVITQRREVIEQLGYGQESVKVFIDTIGKVSVMDSVFVVREPLLSLSEGTISQLSMQEGSSIRKDEVIATIMSSKGKQVKMRAPYNAVVEQLVVREGQQIDRNQGMASLAFRRIANLATLPLIPESKTNALFELFAGKVVKGNVTVNVFEARDVAPVNPVRRRNKNENALRVGSRTEVSVTGNWE